MVVVVVVVVTFIKRIKDKMTIDVKELGMIHRFNAVYIMQSKHYVKLYNRTVVKPEKEAFRDIGMVLQYQIKMPNLLLVLLQDLRTLVNVEVIVMKMMYMF